MKVLLLAGEESGAVYADRLRAALAGDETRGYADYGFATADLAVMGFWAVLRRIFFFLRVKRTMERAIDEWRPDVLLTVDYPGLNLKLAAYAKARGVRTVHVVCPQVWAWKKGRIPKIEASLDRLCCFFPFEPRLFRDGFAEFVGHPLAVGGDGGRAGAEPPAGGGEKLLALLPGSRMGEIEKHMPTLLEVVTELCADGSPLRGKVRVEIPAANADAYGAILAHVARFKSPSCVIETRLGGARDILRRADAAVVASGTATLEAALARCPTVLVYRVSALLAWFARRAIREISHVGLANIIAEKAGAEPPMPELLQESFTAANVTARLEPWLTDPGERARAVGRLDRTMRLLECAGDPIARIAEIAKEGVGDG